jgi:steroid 5-alpha reductase family enzyme
MSNAEFIFFSYLANCLGLTLLVIRSINKKSPRALMRFLFMPILLTFLIGLALQEYMETSIFSNRQLLVSILLFAWCLKSIVSYNSIKIILLSSVLDDIKRAIYKKTYFKIFNLIFRVSLIQLMCFSSALSTNYLSGSQHLKFLDLTGFVICFIGLFIEMLSEKELKNYSLNKTKVVESGLWSISRNPNLIGVFLFFFGIQVIALNAISTVWSIFGFFLTGLIIFKNLIPNMENALMDKFPDYSEYSKRVPKLVRFK